MRHVFRVLSVVLAFLCVQSARAQQHRYIEFWQKGTVYLGKYDTVVGVTIDPDSVCQWTDSSKITIWASVDGFHQINDGMSAYYVGAAKYAGGTWLYSNARVNLSCDTLQILGDNPDFTVIDPLSVADTRGTEIQVLSGRDNASF
jgi:hypothetical protein